MNKTSVSEKYTEIEMMASHFTYSYMSYTLAEIVNDLQHELLQEYGDDHKAVAQNIVDDAIDKAASEFVCQVRVHEALKRCHVITNGSIANNKLKPSTAIYKEQPKLGVSSLCPNTKSLFDKASLLAAYSFNDGKNSDPVLVLEKNHSFDSSAVAGGDRINAPEVVADAMKDADGNKWQGVGFTIARKQKKSLGQRLGQFLRSLFGSCYKGKEDL